MILKIILALILTFALFFSWLFVKHNGSFEWLTNKYSKFARVPHIIGDPQESVDKLMIESLEIPCPEDQVNCPSFQLVDDLDRTKDYIIDWVVRRDRTVLDNRYEFESATIFDVEGNLIDKSACDREDLNDYLIIRHSIFAEDVNNCELGKQYVRNFYYLDEELVCQGVFDKALDYPKC